MSGSNVIVGLWDQENSLGPLVQTEFPDGYYKDLIEFWKLVQAGTAEDVQAEIARGRDVNALDAISGVTSLMVASACSSPEVVQCLIGAGALVNVRSKLVGISDLFRSIEQDHNRVVDIYERRNREQDLMQARNGLRGWTSLELALERGCPEIIGALLAWGADPNTRDGHGVSPLSTAIGNRDIEIIKMLLNRGARVNDQDQAGRTPLMGAAMQYGSLEVVHLLLEAGAEVNARDSKGTTALMWAVRENLDEDVLEALAQAGSTVEFKDADGRTPLLRAMRVQGEVAIKLLIRYGADVRARTPFGQTALMLLFESDDDEDSWPQTQEEPRICELLLNHGVDINAQDNDGKTALMYAISTYHSYPDVLNTLLDADPDLSLKDAKGRTAAQYAKENKELRRRDPLWRLLKK